ncbi:MAG: CoA transferase [Rhodospirillaceae bacterium]|nr:CoA transferase [Rhodospirillaceae bacterium]
MLTPYRVLDLTDDRGQLAGHMLAQMGADVIALEPPGGHRSRRLGPFVGGRQDGESSLLHLAYNRGKRSVVVHSQAEVVRLAATADILIDCGAIDIDLARLRAANPRLITASITPFGQTGPKAAWHATDLTVCAAAGTLGITGDADRAPVRVSVPQAFAFAAADAACAVLLALWERHRSGRGQHADISAQQSYLSATQFRSMAALVGKTAGKRIGGGLKIGSITMQVVHPCRDGHVTASFLFGPVFGPYATRLFEWIHEEGGCDAWWPGNDWISFGSTVNENPEFLDIMAEGIRILRRFMAKKTKAQLFAGAVERRLLIAPINTAGDLLEFEHLRARGWWQSVEGTQAPGAFVRAPASPLRALGRAPRLDEHAALLNGLPRAKVEHGESSASPDDDLPLAGVRVLDFTWALAGPSGTRILADHGATVIRIESHRKMDILRGATPFIGEDGHPENSLSWHSANAGKLGFTLNLRHPGAQAVVLDLAGWADVVVESFSSGTMARLGIGYDRLREVNVSLIMLSSCLLGATGPLSAYAGFGGAGAAIAGFYPLTGWPDRLPAGPYGAYTDYISPRFMVAALVGALEWRRRTGEGQHLDFSQMESAVQLIAPVVLDQAMNGRSVGRCGNLDPHMSPHGVYPARGDDRWVAVACETQPQWRVLARLIGRPNLAELPLEQRRARSAEIDALIAAFTAGRDAAGVERMLQAEGLPVHRVSYAGDIVRDPQLAHRGHFIRVPHPASGNTWVEGSAIRFSRTPGGPKWGGPTFGQHLFEMLSETLGYEPEKIADLANSGVLE